MKPKDKINKEKMWEDIGPKEVKTLLEKYHGIVVDSILASLQPKREVSHCIDFIPGATLPRKAAYKLTPE